MLKLSKYFYLIIITLFPIIGLLFFGWDWREVLILYWLENISIGIVATIDLIRSPNAPPEKPLLTEQDKLLYRTDNIFGKILLVLFFVVIYGLFTFVHGLIVFDVIIKFFSDAMGAITWNWILISWGVSFIIKIIVELSSPASGEPPWLLALDPLKRIFIFQFAIIGAVFVIVLLHLPVLAGVLLIAINVIINLAWQKNWSMARARWSTTKKV